MLYIVDCLKCCFPAKLFKKQYSNYGDAVRVPITVELRDSTDHIGVWKDISQEAENVCPEIVPNWKTVARRILS